MLAHGKSLDAALRLVRKGGRTHPNRVEPAPSAPEGVTMLTYDGVPSRDAFERLNRLIGTGPFHVELGRSYRLEEAAKAHREIGHHHLGKLALRFCVDSKFRPVSPRRLSRTAGELSGSD